jgi:uncharacterized membrane protein YccF (DUF307 family)
VVLTYAAAVWAYISYGAGTCTGNDAGQLNLVVLSVALYFLAAFGFARVQKGRVLYMTLLAILPAVLWQVVFSTWLAIHLLILDTSACSLAFGGPYGFDGHEVRYAVLWLLPLLAAPFALVLRRR